MKTCIHIEKAYKKAILDYNTWLKTHAISKAENFAAEAQAKRDFLMEDMAMSIRQEAEANNLDRIVYQCNTFFKIHINKITAGIDDDIQDFLQKMQIANIVVDIVSIGLGALYCYRLLSSSYPGKKIFQEVKWELAECCDC